MTRKKLDRKTQALTDIAGYPLPSYKIQDKEYVPLEYAVALKELAADALKSK